MTGGELIKYIKDDHAENAILVMPTESTGIFDKLKEVRPEYKEDVIYKYMGENVPRGEVRKRYLLFE